MTLIHQMEQLVEASVYQFCQLIGQQYQLDDKVLYALWKKTQASSKHPVLMIPPDEFVPKKQKRKKSAYSVFYERHRQRLIQENPSLTFGEISKKISWEWKRLSDQEKNQYLPKKDPPSSPPHKITTVVEKDSPSSPPHKITTVVEKESSISLKKTDLFCEKEEELPSPKIPSYDMSPVSIEREKPRKISSEETDSSLKKSPIFDDGSSIPLLMVDLFHKIRASPDTLKREEDMEGIADSPKISKKRVSKKKEEKLLVEKKKSNKRSVKT